MKNRESIQVSIMRTQKVRIDAQPKNKQKTDITALNFKYF